MKGYNNLITKEKSNLEQYEQMETGNIENSIKIEKKSSKKNMI